MRSPLVLSLVALAGSFASLTGCAPPIVSPESPAIAQVWVSRCGGCHTRVEPGTRSRVHLEDAFKRHQRRVRLSGGEWSQLVDYLAKGDATAAAEPAPKASGEPTSH